MSRTLLVLRLVVRDVGRHPAQAVMLLVSLTLAIGALGLGFALHGAAETLYDHTRAVTAGPDVVVLAPGRDQAATAALSALANDPRVAAHSGPEQQFYTALRVRGRTVNTVVRTAATQPGPVDRPLVTAGSWLRPGGVVVERGFADALSIHVGERISVAGRAFPVLGIAVTAAGQIYPWAEINGPYGGPSDRAGLTWVTSPDTAALVAAKTPVTSLISFKLRDPGASQQFIDTAPRDPAAHPNFFTWQFLAQRDATMLRGNQPILVFGSWLLGFLSVVGVTTLAAGRAAAQTRRAGLLKAVGATPELIGLVLFGEYGALALLAAGLGLLAAVMVEPLIINPGGSLITAIAAPSGTIVAMALITAVGVALLTASTPTLRALRTDTVAALADPIRSPRPHPRLTKVSARLPTPFLLGLRLIARRPGRTFLHAASTAATALTIFLLLFIQARPAQGWNLGGTTLPDLQDEQNRHVLLGVTAALIVLALVNTFTLTWTTALEAQTTMAVTRTLGATPAQVTGSLSAAQLLPTLAGAVTGIGFGRGLTWLLNSTPNPPGWQLLTIPLGLMLATAALSALPAHLAAHRQIDETLSAA